MDSKTYKVEVEKLKAYSLLDESLRDYQQQNKQKIYDAWSHFNSVMLQMPTGTGKTRLFVSIIKDIFHFSKDNKIALKVLILVHRTELIDQIDEELGYRYNLAHGIIQSGERERKIYPIQLASVQTLSRRLDNWSDKGFDFIIVDEAHHITADSYLRIINAFPYAKLLGVTATPVRLNGQGFTEIFDELVVSPSVKHFIDEGYLSQYDYYSVARTSFIQREIDEINKFSQGDYAETELERICDNDRIRAQVVKTYIDFAKGKKGIVYTINKEHNKNLCNEFVEKGFRAVAIDSDTPREIREDYIEKFKKGDYQIICNVNLFTEGFDCPDIEFIQLARPTKSLALYLQQVGRGLRISESKEKTIFLDNVGLYNRFGFPSSKRMWKHHFEGKYDGNKTEEEVEGEKSIDTNSIVRHERNQNLEEGHEKVRLIQSTEEIEYLNKRKDEFLDLINEYAISNVAAMNYAFDQIKINGLGLRTENTNLMTILEFYHVFIKKNTTELKNYLKNCKHLFLDDSDIPRMRTYHDYEEMIGMLDSDFHSMRRYKIKTPFEKIISKLNILRYTDAELYEIAYMIAKDNISTKIVPNYAEKRVEYLWEYLFNFWGDYIYFNQNKVRTACIILKGTFDGIMESKNMSRETLPLAKGVDIC